MVPRGRTAHTHCTHLMGNTYLCYTTNTPPILHTVYLSLINFHLSTTPPAQADSSSPMLSMYVHRVRAQPLRPTYTPVLPLCYPYATYALLLRCTSAKPSMHALQVPQVSTRGYFAYRCSCTTLEAIAGKDEGPEIPNQYSLPYLQTTFALVLAL